MIYFPLLTQLQALQQQEYEVRRYGFWWLRHLFVSKLANKKPLVATSKIKMLIAVWVVLWVMVMCMFNDNLFLVAGLALFVFIFPAPLLVLSLTLLFPVEQAYRKNKLARARKMLAHYEHLRIIGITGSFGKTTTKDFLYHLLNRFHYALKTPESYNTDLGIAKVIELELNAHHRDFICEMGAFGQGDIKRLCQLVQPQFGLITAIGPQHLERFGSEAAIARAKFELVDALACKNALVNWDSIAVRDHVLANALKYKGINRYSLQDPEVEFFVPKYSMTKQGISFDLNYAASTYHLAANVFGTSNLYNLVGAVSMALLLKIPAELIKLSLLSLPQSPHRLELKSLGKSMLIDNAFSSNLIGFQQVIADLKSMSGTKVLVTPGLIELGSEAAALHQQLGKQAATIFDSAVLVGKSSRTKAIEIGWLASNTNKPIMYIPDSHLEIQKKLVEFSQQYDWILLENDLPDTSV